MIPGALMYGSIPKFPNMVKNVQDTLWRGPLELYLSEELGLVFGILAIDTHYGSMAFGQPLSELAQLDQAGAGFVVEIALGQPSQAREFAVQIV